MYIKSVAVKKRVEKADMVKGWICGSLDLWLCEFMTICYRIVSKWHWNENSARKTLVVEYGFVLNKNMLILIFSFPFYIHLHCLWWNISSYHFLISNVGGISDFLHDKYFNPIQSNSHIYQQQRRYVPWMD